MTGCSFPTPQRLDWALPRSTLWQYLALLWIPTLTSLYLKHPPRLACPQPRVDARASLRLAETTAQLRRTAAHAPQGGLGAAAAGRPRLPAVAALQRTRLWTRKVK
ncbi:hypothetical protein M885DRAFT_569878 [Pelagophyceae sp. CCMP2097]|nr:hypothetical protein M885DRAFT_569878 [Pelagophyceae sp. CCMP2097]